MSAAGLRVRDERPLGGGMICRTTAGRLDDGRRVVVKRCPYPAEVEADGLRALRAAGAPVPEVLAVDGDTLVLEHVSGTPDWAGLGRDLARLHRATAERFGWHRDNRIGELPQPNGWCDDWPTFFVQRRVLVHLADPAVPERLRDRLQAACAGPLPELLPDRPPASLLHGDLWSGNVVDGRFLVDPAVCHGDRELDIAYLQLFGGVPGELLSAYDEEWPLEEGFERRRPALQLHHLLVHVRLFGGSYVDRVAGVLDRYGW